MTTVTGMTADRMLSIEAASVVDGDVDASGNLILTKHDGSQINAGSVIGPQGPQGPVGSMLSVVTAQPVLDVGVINQIRAGRQLGPADFGNIGLSAPLGLWNLSDLSDASGNGRALSNKGAVPFAAGINGGANTAAQFAGSTAQLLYIPDTGVNDPLRFLSAGSVGCWCRTAKAATSQSPMGKWGSAGTSWFWQFNIGTGNNAIFYINAGSVWGAVGISNVADDRWHFLVGTFDGTLVRIYVDGILEGLNTVTSPVQSGTVASPLNIGSAGVGDSSNVGTNPFFGRVDEAFITTDVLSEDQIRNLYCAKIAHTLAATPARFTLNVRRRRRGAALASSDFPTQPLRLHNFSAGSLGDEGSNAIAFTSNPGTGAIIPVAGVDGSLGNAFSFSGAHNGLSSTDAGLPSGVAPRSFGCWLKAVTPTPSICPIGWGTYNTAGANMVISGAGVIYSYSGADQLTGIFITDGLWHLCIVVEDNGAIDGVKRKMYIDGYLRGISTGLTPLILAGANRFRVGAAGDGTVPFPGQIDGAFVCDYALTADRIAMLYAKSLQTLTPSPKNPGDHIEGADVNNLYAIFDTLDTNAQVDLKVAS